MTIPFCDNPECKLNKAMVGSDVRNLVDDSIRIQQKEYFDVETKKGYRYCKKCYDKILAAE